ncbi:MAG TPA: glutamate-cysteine ligase family protein, partial [Thermoanaerobaculia bacterium]|nr:glutamate-cysteine ligase family protein [Thermoanaerobaculia bacterium]
CNLAILEHLDREHFTTEVGRYNIELNLDPQNLDGGCLDRLEAQLRALLEELRAKAAAQGVETLLVGILPTLEMSDLTLEGMTPVPRYYAINEAMGRLAGGEYHLRIRGQDELLIRHDNVMLESCNTSFQVHLQVSAEEFPLLYNTALAIAAPVLAFATNSPMLFGRRLWRETRIALFQQAIDTRPSTQHLREQAPRVSFGRRWVERSVLEIFQEDVARFPALLAVPIEEDAPAVVASGGTPQLRALRLFNGTVYRWVRPCYGISENGKPHLRIENRILPAGPTVIDEMANAALWYGLMRGVPLAYGDITKKLAFGTARENFTAAARLGSGAQLDWPDHPNIPAQQLLAEELLPLARHGLADLGIEGGSIDRYLGVIEERVRRLRTGAVWQVYSWDELGTQGSRTERLAALTASMLSQQREGKPVSEWKLAAPSELRK